MTPPQVALRQIPTGHDGLIRLHPAIGDVEPRPGETAEEAAYRGAIDAATSILAAYDGGTARHSDDVLTVAEAIADRLNVTGADKKHLTAVAQLHDIGKIMVSSEILNKPGPLSDEEWETMRRHTIEGEEILAAVPEISEVAELVRACHERYDGNGYPDGLAGEQIPLVARIVFCADAFHAMRCDRPYREGRPVREALAEMKANAGTQFDPVVVAALCDVHATLAIQRKHGLGILRSGARSRRLVALLATLTVSGSAMAATGAYKALPVIADSDTGDVPSETRERTGAKGQSAAAKASAAERRAAKAAEARGSKGSSGDGTAPSAGSPRSGDKPAPRGVAHGVNGTAPGQAGRPAKKVGSPKAAPEPRTKAPRSKNVPKSKVPTSRPPQADPKVRVPNVPNAPHPNATTPDIPVKKAPQSNTPNPGSDNSQR